MRRVTKENLIVQIDRLRKVKDEQGQLSMNGEYTLQAYEMLLTTMDSEPVEWLNGCNKSVPAALRYLAENPRPIGGESSFNTAHLYQLAREIELMAEGTLYRHAQPTVSKPWGYTSGILNPAVGMACVTPTRGKNQFPVYIDPQPAPVVPDEMADPDESQYGGDYDEDYQAECAYVEGWNACRAVMLNQK